VPVSTIPAVVDKIVLDPKVMLWSTPKNSFAGLVVVTGLRRHFYYDL
jgi:hypothetical protein